MKILWNPHSPTCLSCFRRNSRVVTELISPCESILEEHTITENLSVCYDCSQDYCYLFLDCKLCWIEVISYELSLEKQICATMSEDLFSFQCRMQLIWCRVDFVALDIRRILAP